MSWYTTGTIAVTNGSATITGTGTAFVANVQQGFALLGPDFGLYEVQSIPNDTSIVLTKPYRGTSATTQAYGIFQTQGIISSLSTQVAALMATFGPARIALPNFLNIYYGPFASDPTTRADGSAMQAGDEYFNTTVSSKKVYTGATWLISSGQTSPTSEVFVQGTGAGTFTVGASSITLTGNYGTLPNIKVHFDGVYQGINQLSTLIGKVLTFTSPIPVGITNIFVDGGLSASVGIPSTGSVGLAQLTSDAVSSFTATVNTQVVSATNSATAAASSALAASNSAAAALASQIAAANSLLTTATGETGVINSQYPVGDVRRYGVFPDGIDVTGLTFNATTAVTATAGTFTSAMIGMIICSPLVSGLVSSNPPKITAVASDGSGCTLASAASSSGTGNARIGTYWERDKSSYTTAIYLNAVLPGIEIVWPAGYYTTSLNFNGSSSSNSKMFFTPGCEFSGLIHCITSSTWPTSGLPLTGMKLRGKITTYDRFGAIGLQASNLSQLTVHTKSDSTKHTLGIVGRGVHMYSGIVNVQFGDFITDDCGVGSALNSDGAFVIDDSGSHDCSFGRIWVKDSAGHGAYILGSGHTIQELRVDGWGYGTQDRQLQESLTLLQSQELCGFWSRRNSGMKIGTCRISQVAGTRTNALYPLRYEESANSTLAPVAYQIPRIDGLYVSNITYRGISIGDRNNPGLYCEISIGVADLSPASSTTISSGYSLIHVNANSSPSTQGRNKLTVQNLFARNNGIQINDLLQVPVNTDVDIGTIDTARARVGHCGAVVTFNGSGVIRRINHLFGASNSGNTSITFAPDKHSVIGQITLDGTVQNPQVTAVNLTGASNFAIGPLNINSYRNTISVIAASASNGKIYLGTLIGYSNQGTALQVLNCTNIRIEDGTISGYIRGTTSAGGNTRCTATNCAVTGNTTNTDIANGQITTDAGCLNVTL